MLADRWGVTDTEVAARYPCDDLVDAPSLEAWRAVTVDAPIKLVWAWLMQVQLAPYSYDWIDNLGRPSPRDLRNLPDPAPGDPFSATAGRPLGRVIAIEHGRHLTAQIMGTTLTYQLIALSPDQTRLILKIVGKVSPPFARLLALGDLVMARRQLLNLKKYAELGGCASRGG